MDVSVYVFNSPHFLAEGVARQGSGYCALTHPLIEGLHDLGVRVVCARAGINVRRTGPFEPTYDLYVVQRGPHFDTAAVFETLRANGCLPRAVLIDSLDHRFGIDPFWAAAGVQCFKKENEPEFGASTFLFCIQNRYIPQTRPEPQDVVFYACRLATHPDRPRIHQQLEKGGWRCERGPLFDDDRPRDENTRLLGYYHNASYFRRLSECKVAVNARGGAVDCYRYWEIAASHAVLVSFPVEEEVYGFEDPPTPGVHYVRYRSVEQVNDAVAEAFDRYEQLHDAQREFFLTHHRSRNRAAAVLRSAGLWPEAAASSVLESTR